MLEQAYINLIDRTHSDCFFLWDSLKSALLLELKAGNEELIIDISKTRSKTSAKRELLIEVVTEYGRSNPIEIANLLNTLANQKNQADSPKIAMETAFNLGNYRILEQLSLHNDASVRQTSAQFTYYLWRRDAKEAWDILSSQTQNVRKWLIPNLRSLEFCLRFSALLLAENYKDKETLDQLHKLWIVILNKVLYRDWDKLPLVGNLVKVIRGKLVSIIAYAAWRWVAKLGEDNSESFQFYTYDAHDLEMFFDREASIKMRYRKLVKYIDPRNQNLEDAGEDLLYIAKSNDIVSSILILVILTAQGMQYDYAETSPATNPVIKFTKKMYDEIMRENQVYIITPFLLQSLAAMGRGYRAESVDQAYLDIMEEAIKKYYDKSRCVARNSRGHEQKVTGFGYYAQLYYLKDPEMNSSFLFNTVQTAINENDYDFLKRYIKDIARPSHAKKNWAILEALRPIIVLLETVISNELQTNLRTDLIEALARVKMHDPYVVEQFLKTMPEATSGFVTEAKKRIESTERRDHLPNLAGRQLAWYIRDSILANPNKSVLNLFLWLIEELAYSKGFDKWFDLLIKTGVNLLYVEEGEPVFKNPKVKSPLRKMFES